LAKQSAIVRDLLLAHVLEREGELVAHLVAHHAADADPTRLGQGFEPGRDVDAVTEDVVPSMTEMSAEDAKYLIRGMSAEPSPYPDRPQ